MRFHIPGLPHLPTSKLYSSCAYTQKVIKLCKMLVGRGHTVYFYGIEGSNPVCTENITVVPEEFYKKYYNYNWQKEFFKFDTKDEVHQLFYKNCISEIKKRMQPRDFLLCAWGWGHQPIAAELPDDFLVVESGIGYSSTFAKYRVFESYAWMHWMYGNNKIDNGSFYDCVIPNFFDPEDFEFRAEKEDYFLYLGRIIKRKGVDIAYQVSKELGAKLIVAGQGSLCDLDECIDIRGDHVEYIGSVNFQQRKELMSRCKLCVVGTYYIGPFEGVSIEAALSGTPVITTDWGAFSENVLHGITGYRCRTFEQFCWAAKNIHNIKPENCRKWAIENFSCDRIVLMYEEYFNMLQDLFKNGWYEKHPERKEMDWLTRYYVK